MSSSDIIWLEKYRPQTLEEVQGNEESINTLKTIAAEGNIPNMILGPPGIGKTSSILCLARFLLKTNYNEAVKELNASDDRGIEVVRQAIKDFAQKKVNLPQGLHKIIILDEADSLTEGAQQALRMIISDYADSTRFVLSCNDSTKIIDAIQSRCAILRFSKLNDKQVCQRLLEIIQKENITYDNDGLEALIFTAEGDMRQAINSLQATNAGFGEIKKELVFKVCDVPNLEIIKKVLENCIDGDFSNAQRSLYKLYEEGFTAYDLCNNLGKVIQNTQFNINLQFEFLNEMTILKMRILEGLSTFLQISGYLAKICEKAIEFKKNNKENL